MALTTLFLSGNVVADPEVFTSRNGKSFAAFTVAVNERVNYKDGKRLDEPEDVAIFYRMTANGPLGENIARSLSKGDRVLVEAKPYMSKKEFYVENSDGDLEPKNIEQIQLRAVRVGAELSFATAEITRNERKDGEGNSAPAKKAVKKVAKPKPKAEESDDSGTDWDF